jgi:large subunit ribosomal protein L35
MGRSGSTLIDCANYPNKPMPKLKTRKAAAKRFRKSGTGKLLRRKAFKNHLLQHKSTKRKRTLSGVVVVDDRDADNVQLMLPYM